MADTIEEYKFSTVNIVSNSGTTTQRGIIQVDAKNVIFRDKDGNPISLKDQQIVFITENEYKALGDSVLTDNIIYYIS